MVVTTNATLLSFCTFLPIFFCLTSVLGLLKVLENLNSMFIVYAEGKEILQNLDFFFSLFFYFFFGVDGC